MIGAAAEPPAEAPPFRGLAVKLDPLAAAKLTEKPGVRLINTKEEMSKQLGQQLAKQLAGQVDFAKEKLAFVSWSSSGPPFSRPKFLLNS